MELLGMVMLRISDPEFSKIRVVVDNKDQRSLQFKVFALYFVVYMHVHSIYAAILKCSLSEVN